MNRPHKAPRHPLYRKALQRTTMQTTQSNDLSAHSGMKDRQTDGQRFIYI